MFQIVAFTVFALLLSRVLRAPRGTWRWILGAAVGLALLSQALPDGHPMRVDLVGGLVTLGWLAAAAVPIGGYVLLIRHLRGRTGIDRAKAPAHPEGLVQIDADAALVADTRRAMAAAGPGADTLSLGWRGRDGAMQGHARIAVLDGLADLEILWVAEGARGQGIGGRLLAAAEAAARARGAAVIAARAEGWQAADFLTRRGWEERLALEHRTSGRRVWLARAL